MGRNRTTEEFIDEAKKVHGDKYDYSISEYKGYKNDIYIICKKHGQFKQKVEKHLCGHGCPKCSNSKLENLIDDFLNINKINYDIEKTFSWLKNENKMK